MDNFFDKLNENKFFIGCMMITVTIGGRFIISELSESQKELIHHPTIRKLFIFCAFFMATRDIQCAIILTILFVLIVGELFNGESILYGETPNKIEDKDKKIDKMIEELNALKNNL
tara:strand:+ start:274 stop:621 length:348 start_codon:yes stop_codon:yes gene_type:complete